MSGPKNRLSGDGFSFYRWTDAVTGEETDVLGVTSIRSLCGQPFNLVNWQLANLADAALGTMKRTVIGPRGGVSEKRTVAEYPSEFVTRYEEAGGIQSKIDDLRKWLRGQADEPRDVAAVRGSITHAAIEKNVAWDRIERPFVENALAELGSRDRKRMAGGVSDDDVAFVRNAVRQYWDMYATMPFIIIAREVQVWNLTAGYAGTFDALIWLLPEGIDQSSLPKPADITIATIKRFGGKLVLADWKTSNDIHTDQVVQVCAYLSAEFVGSDGIKDHRLTALLEATMEGALVHIRPNKWGFHLFHWEPEVVRAFLGSVAFARFLAKHPKPDDLFTHEYSGISEETEAAA